MYMYKNICIVIADGPCYCTLYKISTCFCNAEKEGFRKQKNGRKEKNGCY